MKKTLIGGVIVLTAIVLFFIRYYFVHHNSNAETVQPQSGVATLPEEQNQTVKLTPVYNAPLKILSITPTTTYEGSTLSMTLNRQPEGCSRFCPMDANGSMLGIWAIPKEDWSDPKNIAYTVYLPSMKPGIYYISFKRPTNEADLDDTSLKALEDSNDVAITIQETPHDPTAPVGWKTSYTNTLQISYPSDYTFISAGSEQGRPGTGVEDYTVLYRNINNEREDIITIEEFNPMQAIYTECQTNGFTIGGEIEGIPSYPQYPCEKTPYGDFYIQSSNPTAIKIFHQIVATIKKRP